jgi:hypothetical protein
MNNQLNNQKNRFWTFCFSLVPGAGEMYFGLYRYGLSLMVAFLLLILVPLSLNFAVLAVFCCVIWCYSFLHTRNLRALPLEEFRQLEDHYFWEDFRPKQLHWQRRHRKILAWALIVLGCWMLWNNLQGFLTRFLPGVLSALMWRIPQLAIGAGILLVGIWMIQGKRLDLEDEEAQALEEDSFALSPERDNTEEEEANDHHADA